jgi:Tol biopolymer transport system component
MDVLKKLVLSFLACVYLMGCTVSPTQQPTPTSSYTSDLPEPAASSTQTQILTQTTTLTITPTATQTVTLTPLPPDTSKPSPTATRLPHADWIALTLGQEDDRVIHIVHPDGSSLERLVEHPGMSFDPQWSPDGERIAFKSKDASGNPYAYVMDFETKTVQKIDVPGVELVKWSPNSRRIAFLASDKPHQLSLYVYEIETRLLAKIDAPDVYSFDWSPEGNQIAYVIQGYSEYIYSFSIDDYVSRGLVKKETNIEMWDIIWSPKGDSIFAIWVNRFAPTLCWGMNVWLSGKRDITGEKTEEIGYVSWSPSGDQYAYTTYNQGEDDGSIVIVQTQDNTREVYLRFSNIYEGFIDWSINGTWLLFTDKPYGRVSWVKGYGYMNVYIMNVNTRAIIQLPPAPGLNMLPSWSADGTQVIYVHDANEINSEQRSLYIYDIETRDFNLILTGEIYSAPAWRP